MLILPLPLIADTTYTYTGTPYTSAQSPYTTSDFISGSFTVSSPLAPNLVQQVTTITSFSFSDGVNSFSFIDGVQSTTGVFPPLSGAGFVIWTDGTGDISQWALGFTFGTQQQGFVQSINVPSNSIVEDSAGFIGSFEAFNSNDPGTWTPSNVPEPSTLALLGTGILGLAGAARRKFLLHS
jgi:hypothetical protein